MKQTKAKSTQPCSYCKIRAKWKCQGCSFTRFACEEHKPQLGRYEAENQDDGYMTEADYQTWGRL